MLKASKIKPFLWFEARAEDDARFYTSIFRNAERVMQAILGMVKLDIAKLKEAAR